MHVSSILQTKGVDVVTVVGEAPLHTAIALLQDRGVGALVVSADGVTVDGLLSERDVVHHFGVTPSSLADPVITVASRDVQTCSPCDRIEDLMAIMTNGRFRHLPVVDKDRLAGIVSIGDVVKWRLTELESTQRHLETYIAGVPS